ncbi:MAG: ParB/RepB/Spo0J family partition protein [Mycoplasmatota bacterium]
MNERIFSELDVEEILPNRFQPRIKFNEESLNELAKSIKEHGVIEPIVVRKLGDKYEIIAGERRYKASVLAGRKKIPAIVTDMNDRTSSEVALIENVQRENLTPIEEAISYKKILDMNYLTQQDLAIKLGKKQPTIANKLRLLELSDEVQEALLEEEISERHARSLLRLKKESDQISVLERIVKERLTVKKTDVLITEILSGSNQNIKTPENIVSLENQIKPEQNEEMKTMENEAKFTIPEIVSPESNITMNPMQETNSSDIISIESLLNNSQDIYQPKPLANMDTLLQSSTPEVKVEQVPTIEEAVKPGRFFNMMPEEEVIVPKVEEKISLINNVQPEPLFKPVEAVVENSEQTSPFLESNDNALSKTEESPIVTPVPTEIDYSKFYEPLDDTPKEEVAPIVTPVYNNYALRDTEEIEIKPYETPIVEGVNMKTVVNAIRECAKTIEGYGYVLDLDEMDLPNLYQATFKITKK